MNNKVFMYKKKIKSRELPKAIIQVRYGYSISANLNF